MSQENDTLKRVKKIIAVASGKGGVGKSTVAVNLALALHQQGARVGLLDADIYGPSQPTLLGATQKPDVDGKKFVPLTCHGIQSMSIGYLTDADTAIVWRGPMVTGALMQMLQDTLWDELDYLIIDLPPGTGDIQLTLTQKIPLTGVVIVTTPQDLATDDAKRAVAMFEKVRVPVLGVIENMSYHVCGACGHEEAVFGVGGAAAMAERTEAALLGSLPLDASIRECSDAGTPIVIADKESIPAQRYQTIAKNLSAQLAAVKKDYSKLFPNIVVKNA